MTRVCVRFSSRETFVFVCLFVVVEACFLPAIITYCTHACAVNDAHVLFFCMCTAGPNTPLFCEFLSPWVLLKEVQTVLKMHGIESIQSPTFRTKCPTIFWNLVVYFNRFHLPSDFLLREAMVLSPTARARLQREDELDRLENHHG
jgi:hypothetical protein